MISNKKYPVDIVLCVLWSAILLPLGLLDVGGIIRIIFGLPFIFFIPGYILISALFPTKKTEKGLGILERIVLSLGFSIALVPLIGLYLNYTSWGISLESVLLSNFIFVIIVGVIAIFRWFKTPIDERYIISLDLSLISSKNKLDKALNKIIIISIIISITTCVYIFATPNQGEKFTDFYILTSDPNEAEYPKSLTVEENGNVIIGIFNHEYETIEYTVEVWLIKEYDDNTIIQNMWFVDKMSVALSHKELEIGESSITQWENDYSFSISKTGLFKLVFLLYTSPTVEYNLDIDYIDISQEKIDSAYRETHLWINVN